MGTASWNRRMMVFVDGTNFILRLEDYAGVRIDPHKPQPAIYELVKDIILAKHVRLTVEVTRLIRCFWFGSFRDTGPEPMEKELWKHHFTLSGVN